MDIDTFVARAEAQPVVEVRRTVGIHGPELRALIAEGRIALLSEIRAHPDQHEEQRRFRYRHVLEPGAAASEIAAWEAEHPHHPLPEDLIAFLGRADGVHLWADVSTGRSEYGILPLADWRDAGRVEWSEMYVDPPQGRLVISYHDNGDYFIVLDTSDRSYHWYDLQDFDNPALIGRTVAELLGWYWEHADELDPRSGAD